MTPPNKAFVIGPIGDRDAADGSDVRIAYEQAIQVFEEVIAPACTGFGLEASRADMISETGEIPEQIFRQLRDSPVVIADLTGANPNVMYELGLRHTTGKITIQIGERGRLPFDVASIRTIMFKRTDAGLVQARKDLAKSLAATLDTGGNPVTATRIWFESPMRHDELVLAENEESEPLEEDEAPGFLELLAEMEDGNQSLVQTLAAATSITEDISKVYSDATTSVREADARGGGASGRLVVANRTADLLDNHVSRMEVVAGDYERTVQRIEPGLRFLIEHLKANPSQLAEAPGIREAVVGLAEVAQTTIGGVQTMREQAQQIGKASRSLKLVGQRLSAAFGKIANVSAQVTSWGDLARDLPTPSEMSRGDI